MNFERILSTSITSIGVRFVNCQLRAVQHGKSVRSFRTVLQWAEEAYVYGREVRFPRVVRDYVVWISPWDHRSGATSLLLSGFHPRCAPCSMAQSRARCHPDT